MLRSSQNPKDSYNVMLPNTSKIFQHAILCNISRFHLIISKLILNVNRYFYLITIEQPVKFSEIFIKNIKF